MPRARAMRSAEEADAGHVTREPVRVFAHGRDGAGAVSLVDARRVRRADSIRLQEHHDITDAALFTPGDLDRGDAQPPEPRHLVQGARLLRR